MNYGWGKGLFRFKAEKEARLWVNKYAQGPISVIVRNKKITVRREVNGTRKEI